MRIAGPFAVAALAAHAAPALTSCGPLRRTIFPSLSGQGDPGRVALTFDDGPDPTSTPLFVEALAALEVRATFFVLGRMLSASPEVGRLLVESGHEVAVHGWDHRLLLARGPRSTLTDLTRARDEVIRTCGVTPTRWRPPYGVLTSSALLAARRTGLTPVLWTAWGRDWEHRATGATVRAHVARHLGSGGTVLLHDSDCTSSPESWRATLEALPKIVQDIRELGLQPGPLSDHDQDIGP